MSATDCYVDGYGCIVCPEVLASPGAPAKTVTSNNPGWNAGANSITVLDGDLHVVDALAAAPVDMYFGLKYSRAGVGAPFMLAYAFRIYSLAHTTVYEIWEGPQMRAAAASYTLGATLEIRRVGGIVSYWAAGAQVYQSAVPSSGPLLVSACLYSAGDSLP